MTKPQIKCAIYTRKSTEEGLLQDFNTLDAQRESCEAYIRSQLHQGWDPLSTHYDDGGFTGGNMDRPALRRLIADIKARKVDIVVCYKVDRFSRSLHDFSELMRLFSEYNVSFVSITQQIDTSTSMGRLMLHVLMSFAQFERELISERTRDKMAAARRKGKWLGGRPVLGYDVDATTKKLIVSEVEASQVRSIFELYIEYCALLPVVQELNRRGWVNKAWTNKKGECQPGVPFTKTTLHYLLTNVLYRGMVRYKDEVHAGEQAAVIDATLWQKVQSLLQRNGRAGGAAARNKHGALLKGLLFCKPCDCAMTPAHTTKGNRRYRYYTCTHAQKTGWKACPSKSIPANEIEQFVVEQVRQVAQNPVLVTETLQQLNAQRRDGSSALESELRGLERDLAHWNRELLDVAQTLGNVHAAARLADLQERIASTERRATEVRNELANLQSDSLNETDVAATLANFDAVWSVLTPREQTRVVELLISRVDYDGGAGKVAVTFRPDALPLLANQLLKHEEAA